MADATHFGPVNPRALLHVARQMPEATNLIAFFETAFREFWEEILGITIDRVDFTARCLAKWNRSNVRGLTIEPITLAAIIEASAHLTVTHEQIVALRQIIRSMNDRMVTAALSEAANG